MSDEKTIKYNTRDGNGNDIVTEVKIKQFQPYNVKFICSICGNKQTEGKRIKDIVSSSFTDWAYVSDYVCPRCADLFSLYFYSYTVNEKSGIKLLNVREIRDVLLNPPEPPFMFCITKSKKKHLFYRAVWNSSRERFAVNLETETIYTTVERMRELFDFVECLQTLGASKERMLRGEIPFSVCCYLANPEKAFEKLRSELLDSREIQIPLFCGQKREISEEEAKCVINSILTA